MGLSARNFTRNFKICSSVVSISYRPSSVGFNVLTAAVGVGMLLGNSANANPDLSLVAVSASNAVKAYHYQQLENYHRLVEGGKCEIPTQFCSGKNYQDSIEKLRTTEPSEDEKNVAGKNVIQAGENFSQCPDLYAKAGIPFATVSFPGGGKPQYRACLPKTHISPEYLGKKETLGREKPVTNLSSETAPKGCIIPNRICVGSSDGWLKNLTSGGEKYRQQYDYSNEYYAKNQCRLWLNAQGFPVVETKVGERTLLSSCNPDPEKFASEADVKKYSWIAEKNLPSTIIRGDDLLPEVKSPKYEFKKRFPAAPPECRYIQSVSESTGLRQESSGATTNRLRSADLVGGALSSLACEDESYCVAQVECMGNLHVKGDTKASDLRNGTHRKKFSGVKGQAELNALFENHPYVKNVRALSTVTCSLSAFQELARDLPKYKKAGCADIPASWCQANAKNQRVENAPGEIRFMTDETAEKLNSNQAN